MLRTVLTASACALALGTLSGPAAAAARPAPPKPPAARCATSAFGPLVRRTCLAPNAKQVDVAVMVAAVPIGHCVLTPQDPYCTVGGQAHGFQAQDIESWQGMIKGRAVVIHQGGVCVPIIGCRTNEQRQVV